MNDFKSVLALWNDKLKLNTRKTLELLELMSSFRNTENMDIESLEGYLQSVKDNSSYYSDISRKLLENLNREDLDYYEGYISNLESDDKHVITFLDEDYPEKLKQISKPPLVLYISGNISALENNIAVVGTREANNHRKKFAGKISENLAKKNYNVVSGLALGIDTSAHKGALREGNTVAVLPGHLDEIHPKSNQELSQSIERHGALVSEVSGKMDINRRRFVKRNRIISGISQAVIIGASGETGGTIHQARYAKMQKREILVYYREDDQSPEKLMKSMNAKPFRSMKELDLRLSELEDSSEKTNLTSFT